MFEKIKRFSEIIIFNSSDKNNMFYLPRSTGIYMILYGDRIIHQHRSETNIINPRGGIRRTEFFELYLHKEYRNRLNLQKKTVSPLPSSN